MPAVGQSKIGDCQFIQKLAKSMREVDFRTLSESHSQSPSQSYAPYHIHQSTHLWMRIDRVQKPLDAPYKGLHKVISWKEKVVTNVRENGTLDTISIDRVKPAILPATNLLAQRKKRQTSTPPSITSSQASSLSFTSITICAVTTLYQVFFC